MYDNDIKDAMRAWTWNRIKERTDGPLSTATAFYLAGEGDFDRPVAVSVGFSGQNVYAIDLNDKSVKTVKKSGGRAMKGDLYRNLIYLPLNREPDAISADLMCGIYQRDWSLFRLLFAMDGRAVAINLKRGRDPKGGQWVRLMKQGYLNLGFSHEYATTKVIEFIETNFEIHGNIRDPIKHRGALLLFNLASQCLSRYKCHDLPDEIVRMIRHCRPVITSYKSKDDHRSIFDLLTFKTVPHSMFEFGVDVTEVYKTMQSKLAARHPKIAKKNKLNVNAFKAQRTKDIQSN